MARPASAQPTRLGTLRLTAFLAAATVPALLSWTSRGPEEDLQRRHAELTGLLRAGVEGRRRSLPPREGPGVAPADFAANLSGERPRLGAEIVFSTAELELFTSKSRREGEFERALQPPVDVTATAAKESVEVAWAPPAGLAELRSSLGNQPLLRLGFRVYRWRDGDEPKLLTTFEGDRTAYEDRDLPLWRERFFYCVATVIEGTIGDLPTLIESKPSHVIPVETIERFTLEVVEGDAGRVHLSLHALVDGRTLDRRIDAAVGDAITPAVTDETPPELALRLQTGLTLESTRFVDSEVVETVQRPEFLPDGRRKLDPGSGLPTFRSESVARPLRTLEVTCRDRAGSTRTFTSAPLN